MTNFEYYEAEILEIINNGNSLGVCKGKPVRCTSIECSECISSDGSGCDKGIYNWLYAEHKEQPKLTKKERQFCDLVETGWIVRGELGDLNFWIKKPEKRHQGAYGYLMASSNDDEKYIHPHRNTSHTVPINSRHPKSGLQHSQVNKHRLNVQRKE